MTSMNDDFQAMGALGQSLDHLLARLRPGGPPVDYGLVVDFIDDKLDPDQRRSVGEAIVTWKAWYDAYWEIIGADGLDAGIPLPEDDHSQEGLDTGLNEWLVGDNAKELQSYLDLGYSDLVGELPAYATAVKAAPLDPYRPMLRTVLCDEWNWAERRDGTSLNDPFTLTAAVAKALSDAAVDMPFPPSLVAAILVKEGLDFLCSRED